MAGGRTAIRSGIGVSVLLVFGLDWFAAHRTHAQSGAAIDYTTAHLERKLTAGRASGTITLDGTLDERAWSDAPVARGFIQNDPNEGEPATFDTEVRVLYDDQALYFGVFAADAEPSGIIVSDLKKDFNTGTSDGSASWRPGTTSSTSTSPFGTRTRQRRFRSSAGIRMASSPTATGEDTPSGRACA
jgi:hypothetical protein